MIIELKKRKMLYINEGNLRLLEEPSRLIINASRATTAASTITIVELRIVSLLFVVE